MLPSGRSVRANMLWASAGNAVFAASQWAMIAVLAKLGTPETVGAYALGIATATPLLMLAQLNLRTVLATDAGCEHDFHAYRNLRSMALAIAVVLIGSFAVWSYAAAEARIIVLASLCLAVTWMSDIHQGLMQAHERMDRAAISLAASGILSVTALLAGMLGTGSIELSLAAVLTARVLVLVGYDAGFAIRDFAPRRPRALRNTGRILRTALPLGAVMMIGSLSPNVPRYFIANSLGTHALGIFSAIASLTTAANLLVNALGQAATPRLAKLYAAGKLNSFRNLTARLTAAGILMALIGAGGALWCGPTVLRLAFRPEYAAHNDLLLALSIAAGLNFIGSLLGYAISACRQFREQVPLQIAAVASAAGASCFLIPSFGLQGAAFALCVAALVQIAGECIVLRSALLKVQRIMPAAMLAEGSAA